MFLLSPTGSAWGAVFTVLMLTGCVTDIRARRIPNSLVLATVIGGLGYSLATQPLGAGISSSIAGLLLGFVIWIVFYIVGALGAGDVKFFAAAGTWLGPAATWRAALVAALFGGIIAAFFLLRERRFSSTLHRMLLAASSRSTSLLLEPATVETPARRHLPYGVALAAGALVAAWWPGFVS